MPRIIARSLAAPSGAWCPSVRPTAATAVRSARRPRWAAIAAATALAIALPAGADDLDVYRAGVSSSPRPNVLFVLDFSGSMQADIQGNNHTLVANGFRRIDILREAVTEVLEANADTINVGLGSIFDSRPSGVRWPIAPLDADPHTVDPDIPPGRYTMSDVITRQLHRRGAGGNTRTVNALAEAAQYFRGGPVDNGADPKQPAQHEPDTWVENADPTLSGYDGGAHEAAIRASYAPAIGYWADQFEDGNFDYCQDDTPSGGGNGCTGLPVIPGSCVFDDGGTATNENGHQHLR